MRSNGAVHIGNDAFLAVTRDVTDSAFLFSSSFPPEEQLAPLPLSRKTRFYPHASLACTAAERERYAQVAAAAAGVQAATDSAAPRRADDDATATATATATGTAAATATAVRHSAHASSDGRKVAFISNTRRQHYIVDISVEPAAVCELEMPELVRSVCWHPRSTYALCVLCVSGDLTIYDTTDSHLGVVVPRHRRIALRPVVERCLADAAEREHQRRTASDPASDATVATAPKSPTVTAPLPAAKAVAGAASPTAYSGAVTAAERVASYHVHTSTDPSGGTIVSARHKTRSPSHAAAERAGYDEVAPVTGAADVADESSPPSPTAASTTAALLTSQLDLVDMHALPATESMPVILLLLSSSGDVFAIHLSDDAAPVLATAAVTDDGRLRAGEEEEARRTAELAAAPPSVETHHLIAGDSSGDDDVALAVGGCLVDADAGTHAVFVCTAGGLVKGAWVSEPDLLARHRVVHTRATGTPNVSFTLHLSSAVGARASLSPAVPTTTHGVSVLVAHNVCVVRTGRTGAQTYVLAFPRWDRQRQGWACWRPACADARERAREEAAVPLLSTDAAVPAPLALRLPYDTTGASVAVGCTELILVPETASTDAPCERHRIITVRFASLLLSAVYARCGVLQPQPRPTSSAETPAGPPAPTPTVVDALRAVPRCHRLWMRGAPEAEVSSATVELVTRVERLAEDVGRRELEQARRRHRLLSKLEGLERRAAEVSGRLAQWRQTILDGVVHRRGGDAFLTANERLGKVFATLNELEQQL
ncbi:hypothetical protein NESM_000647900 [Novymonas esmeraldas]|uniref:Uncharacterized protein n=1 Tax=Novymonas esmeraldas TaxID=1808958 RepID=A0AAW0ETI3_9TRYP